MDKPIDDRTPETANREATEGADPPRHPPGRHRWRTRRDLAPRPRRAVTVAASPDAPPTPRHQISVIERRLQGPTVFRQSSQPIPMREPGHWQLYWENGDVSASQVYDTINQKGWEYVEPRDLACAVEEIGAQVQAGRIVRGPRGAEVLLKMRVEDYRAVQAAKTRENIRATFGAKENKSAIVGGASTALGDEAASFLHKSIQTLTLKDGRERVALDEQEDEA